MRLQVSLRAEDLGNIARGWWRRRRSSPYAVVASAEAGAAAELGRTEVLHQNLNPRWTTIFFVEYDESRAWTPLKISLRDCRSSKEGKEGGYGDADPSMGEADLEVGEIFKMEGQEKKVDLAEGGRLFVHVTESAASPARSMGGELASGVFHCHLRALDLQNIESGLLGLGNIDPYLEVSKKYVDPASGIDRWVPVYRSESIFDIINPLWRPFALDVEKLCHGDLGRTLKIAVWDHEEGGKGDRWLGDAETSAEWLMRNITRGGNASKECALELKNNSMEEAGLIVVLRAEVAAPARDSL